MPRTAPNLIPPSDRCAGPEVQKSTPSAGPGRHRDASGRMATNCTAPNRTGDGWNSRVRHRHGRRHRACAGFARPIPSPTTPSSFSSATTAAAGARQHPITRRQRPNVRGRPARPCIIRWPAACPPAKPDALLTTLEILPTLLQVSDVKPLQDIIFDGFDMLPVLQGKAPSTRNHVLAALDDVGARVGDWKWVTAAEAADCSIENRYR